LRRLGTKRPVGSTTGWVLTTKWNAAHVPPRSRSPFLERGVLLLPARRLGPCRRWPRRDFRSDGDDEEPPSANGQLQSPPPSAPQRQEERGTVLECSGLGGFHATTHHHRGQRSGCRHGMRPCGQRGRRYGAEGRARRGGKGRR